MSCVLLPPPKNPAKKKTAFEYCLSLPRTAKGRTQCYNVKGQSPENREERWIPEQLQTQLWILPASQQRVNAHTKQPEK